jgi:RHS repeat-associated protein
LLRSALLSARKIGLTRQSRGEVRRGLEPRGSRILIDGVEEMAEYAGAGAGGRTLSWQRDPTLADALLGQKIGVASEGLSTHPLTDALGSVYGLVDAAGALRSQYIYDVYGKRSPQSESVPTPWGFIGRRHHASQVETYHRERFSDVDLGVWLAPDPLQDVDGTNLYRYARNNPTTYRYPTGLLVEIYCRLTDWNSWSGGGPRHCAVWVRCEFGKDYCAPMSRKPIPDRLYELSQATTKKWHWHTTARWPRSSPSDRGAVLVLGQKLVKAFEELRKTALVVDDPAMPMVAAGNKEHNADAGARGRVAQAVEKGVGCIGIRTEENPPLSAAAGDHVAGTRHDWAKQRHGRSSATAAVGC